MVMNSTAINGEHNSSKAPLIVDTAALNNEDFTNFLTITDEIERNERARRSQRRSRSQGGSTLKATMTREEIFECSTLDDDKFLTALEFQNSYVPPSPTRNAATDISRSIENLMKYFDEEVPVDCRSACGTPTKIAPGKVAAVVANFKTKSSAEAIPSPMLMPVRKVQPEIKPTIKELKKKYESSSSSSSSPSQMACNSPAWNKTKSQKKPQVETPTKNNSTPQKKAQVETPTKSNGTPQKKPQVETPTKTKSPKGSRKSKVKQMAQMFNAKITQYIKREPEAPVHSYSPLHNELSPEAKPLAPLLVAPRPSPRQTPRQSPRSRRKMPMPSPRSSRKPMPVATPCLVAEDVFRQLSVKDKALLYNKFIDDMSVKHPKFGKHADIMQEHVKKEFARGEVVAEKQETVKHLREELEAKCTFPKSTVSPMGVQRMDSMCDGKATLPKRRSQSQSPPTTTSRMMKSKEAEDILNSTVKCTEEEHFDYHEEDSLHISTLTVVLKPSPECKGRSSTIQRNPSKLTLRKKRELDFLNCLGIVEPTQKRHNESLRSTFSTEAYAPPKKIRRTRTERVTSSMFFQNPQLEQLFYNWLKEKNGVSFDIASVANMEETIMIGPQAEHSAVSVDEESHKSAVEKLLEEAIAKLENVELSQKSRDAEERQRKEASSVEEKEIDTAAASVVEPTQQRQNPEKHDVISSKQPQQQTANEVGRAAPIAMPRLQTPVRTPRKKKPAPPIPAQRKSVITDSSAASSAKQSEAEESESGLSSNPKPPENELQKSHDQNPAALSEHQLRVQASLQRLNIPDWFRQYNQNTARSPDGGISGYKPGNFTRKRATESGRWAGLNSKTTSLSSLGSQRSDRSPLLLSPSAHSHHGGQTAGVPHAAGQGAGNASHTGAGHGAFSRWSTSHLNSSQTSPSVSQRGTFIRGGPVNSSFMSVASGTSSVIRNSYRQPYLGWRSTEKLSQRTPHERLASSLLQQQRTSPTQAHGVNGVANVQAVTPEIQSSIKEVTSAIVHYVNDQTNEQRSRSTSPNSRKCWLESSFVGVRPLDSPQTPVIDGTPTASGGGTNFSLNNSIYQSSTASTLPGGATGYRNPQSVSPTFINAEVVRMNGRLSIGPRPGGAPESSMSSASLEDVLASLLGLPTTTSISTSGGGGASTATDGYARSSTTGNSVSEPQQQQQIAPAHIADNITPQQQHMPQQVQPLRPQQSSPTSQHQQQQQQLLDISAAEQQRLRRRSEGDAPNKHSHKSNAAQPNGGQSIAADDHSGQDSSATTGSVAVPRRVSLGDSTTDTQCKNAAGELQIKCRNTKCDRSATPTDAKKYYKSCHNCTHLYCSRECRRAHWEKHRKACLHSRASNLCRQVLATCKDDVDSQRHLSLLARKGFLSQGRGVVRVLFRSAESAEGFIKHGFQCMGEASYVRWPDLMPAEMGLELYSELLKLSTEYKPDSKMLIYVAICVVSEAPGMGQAPVRWERQLVSRCAKLKLCKSILHEMEQAQLALQQQPMAVVAIPEPTTEILILTFNPGLLRSSQSQRELILSNTLDILSRRGVFLRKHYPEIYQRLQTYTDGQTDKFNPVTLHPRDSQTGQSFVCIIMPVHSDTEIIKLPSIADGGNRVTTIDVGSPAALAQLDDDELLTRSTS